ncbi:MAG: hypothetical protein KDB90_02270 [Planctomycetes bacterium]|nr:hypothetical protein [Planctomycetota bacterium]
MTNYSTIIRSGALYPIRIHNADDRLPEDSGEWHPVPANFRQLPIEPCDGHQHAEHVPRHKLRVAATLLPLLQLVTGLGILYVSYGSNCSTSWWFITPFVIGVFTSLVASCIAVSGTELRIPDALGGIMLGQLYWLGLLLIPCYGWGLLIVCVPMCVLGTALGTLMGAGMQTMEGPTGSGHGSA